MIQKLIGALGLCTMIVSIVSAQQHGDIHTLSSENPHHANQQSESSTGPHGGQLQKVSALRAESVVHPGGIRLYLYNMQGQPIDTSKSRGLATLQFAGDAKRYRYDLFPEVTKDNLATSLGVAVDLSRIAGRQLQLSFQVVGISKTERKPTHFTTTAIVPLSAAQQVAAAIESQKVCPVSGHPLYSMGKPIGVNLGKQTIYVCCASCIDTLKANPAKYLAAKPTLKISKAMEADAQAIAQQQLCPVMDEPLGSMGKPLKVTGLRRDVYLCCKGCLKFLEKEPEKYLAKLPPLPTSAKQAVVKATKQDARFVAAQKLCPVMDEPLAAMGGPYKTVVEGRVVYLCCPGCAKKLHSNPRMYFEKLAKLGVTPPSIQ